MKIRLCQNDLMDILLETSYPSNFASEDPCGLTERYYSAEILGGKGSYYEIFLENIHIGYGDLIMNSLTELIFESDMETVEMHFALSGDVTTRDMASNRSYDFSKNQHNIIYASNFKGNAQFPACQDLKIFEVNLLPGFFKRFLPKEERIILRFLRSLDRGESSLLSPVNYPITPAMHHLIHEIIHSKRKGIFKRIFLEAKVTELLLLQIEQMTQRMNPQISRMKPVEVDRMHAIRDYLLAHLSDPHTIHELANKFGTNEYALKTGFKTVFGSSVFNFWNAAKMNYAKKMLLEGELTVSEVSDNIGYKHPQHFSTAFKKRFGYSPGKLR
ncbi:MAG: AraC family transcriptional regulator [Bacteroidota bacterium]